MIYAGIKKIHLLQLMNIDAGNETIKKYNQSAIYTNDFEYKSNLVSNFNCKIQFLFLLLTVCHT